MAHKRLYLMQGIPGSGKSTVAEGIRKLAVMTDGPAQVDIFSTDEFWYLENSNVYAYDPTLAGEAHRWNQQRTIEAMQKGVWTIIIDNTNIKKSAAKPYLMLAEIYGYEVTVIRVVVPAEVAIDRQKKRPKDRQIPAEVIIRMHGEMEDLG
jgi:predicted kinase